MTANKIMTPLAGVLLAGWFVNLALRTRHLKASNASDTGAIARSAVYGIETGRDSQ
jgi:hypothetical protein